MLRTPVLLSVLLGAGVAGGAVTTAYHSRPEWFAGLPGVPTACERLVDACAPSRVSGSLELSMTCGFLQLDLQKAHLPPPAREALCGRDLRFVRRVAQVGIDQAKLEQDNAATAEAAPTDDAATTAAMNAQQAYEDAHCAPHVGFYDTCRMPPHMHEAQRQHHVALWYDRVLDTTWATTKRGELLYLKGQVSEADVRDNIELQRDLQRP